MQHRYLPASYRDRIHAMGELAGFPALARRSPVVRDALWGGLFLSRQTAAFDLMVGSVVSALLLRKPLVGLGVLPWVRLTWPETHAHTGRPGLIRLAQLAILDAAGAAALARGSLRHRRVVL